MTQNLICTTQLQRGLMVVMGLKTTSLIPYGLQTYLLLGSGNARRTLEQEQNYVTVVGLVLHNVIIR